MIVKPLPLAQALANSPVCANDTLTLTAADAGIGATYVMVGKTPQGFRLAIRPSLLNRTL